MRARPANDGARGSGAWVLDGTVVWVTSWGLADVLLVGAVTPADQAVLALVPARAAPGLRPSAPLALAAMEATVTVRLKFAAAYALLDEVRAATTLVAAAGGAGMARSSAAQRLGWEALFHLVQAQTAPVRRATLARLGEVAP